MLRHRVDRSRAMAVWYFHGKINSDADYQSYVDSILELKSVLTPEMAGVGLMFVEPENPVPNATWRRRIAEASADIGAGCMYALVCDSLAVRGAATAINWLRPPKYDFRAFAELDEAYAWFQGRHGSGLAAKLRSAMDELRTG